MFDTDFLFQSRLWLADLTGGVARQARALAAEIDWDGMRAGAPTILCLERALFRKDIQEMRARTGLGFVEIAAARVKKYQQPWVAPQYRKQTYFYGYLEGDLRGAKGALTRFGTAFLTAASETHQIDSVLAANTDYWQDEAIKLGCEVLGIPFLVLCRENYVWQKAANAVLERFKESGFKFRGQGVAVASEITRQTMRDSGSFETDAVSVTGWPRFDCWFGRRRSPNGRRAIVLLSYAEPRYLGSKNFSETLQVFADCALAYGEHIPFIIKTKKANEINGIFELCPRLKGTRIIVTGTRPLTEIYDGARLVIGYNSIAVLEALLSDVLVVVPWWGDTVRPQSECLMSGDNPEDRKVAAFPTSAAALGDLIEAGVKGEPRILSERSDRLARFSAHSSFDQSAASSVRVENWIRGHLVNIKAATMTR